MAKKKTAATARPAAAERSILSVRILREVDTDPDLSFLGTYAARPDPDRAFVVNREEIGDMGRGECKFFNASPNYDGETATDAARYTMHDYRRMEAYNRSEWWMLGICALATVVLTGTTIQTLTSGGLWGIESDSGEEYFAQIEREELDNLAEQLRAAGFTDAAIREALANVERPD
jgi:hypothetical protein